MGFGYACDRCRQKHQSCDHQLPCQRCVKASCGEACHYTPKRPRSRKNSVISKSGANHAINSAVISAANGNSSYNFLRKASFIEQDFFLSSNSCPTSIPSTPNTSNVCTDNSDPSSMMMMMMLQSMQSTGNGGNSSSNTQNSYPLARSLSAFPHNAAYDGASFPAGYPAAATHNSRSASGGGDKTASFRHAPSAASGGGHSSCTTHNMQLDAESFAFCLDSAPELRNACRPSSNEPCNSSQSQPANGLSNHAYYPELLMLERGDFQRRSNGSDAFAFPQIASAEEKRSSKQTSAASAHKSASELQASNFSHVPNGFPSSGILDGIHYSTSKLYENMPDSSVRYYGYDSSALLASGILVQECVKEALHFVNDDLIFAEGLPHGSLNFHEGDFFGGFADGKNSIGSSSAAEGAASSNTSFGDTSQAANGKGASDAANRTHRYTPNPHFYHSQNQHTASHNYTKNMPFVGTSNEASGVATSVQNGTSQMTQSPAPPPPPSYSPTAAASMASLNAEQPLEIGGAGFEYNSQKNNPKFYTYYPHAQGLHAPKSDQRVFAQNAPIIARKFEKSHPAATAAAAITDDPFGLFGLNDEDAAAVADFSVFSGVSPLSSRQLLFAGGNGSNASASSTIVDAATHPSTRPHHPAPFASQSASVNGVTAAAAVAKQQTAN